MLAQRQSVNSEPCRLLPIHRGHIRVEWSCLDRRAWCQTPHKWLYWNTVYFDRWSVMLLLQSWYFSSQSGLTRMFGVWETNVVAFRDSALSSAPI